MVASHGAGGLLRQQSSLKPCAPAPAVTEDWFDPRQSDKVQLPA